MFPAVVSTQWLHDRLVEQADNIRVLDVTWFSDKHPQHYDQCHIAGAGQFDIMKGVVQSETFPRNLPDPADFQRYVRSFGISDDTHVVVYDNQGKAGSFVASRAWWMFKLHGKENVSVLDGGLEKWLADDLPTVQDAPVFLEGTFTIHYTERLKKCHVDMVTNLSDPHFQVCDSRDEGKFADGHYPDARNIPFAGQLLDRRTNTLKSEAQLAAAFASAGVAVDRPLVVMCTSGMSSCALMLAAYVCGNQQCALYHGGFNEWKLRASSQGLPVSSCQLPNRL